MCIRDSVNTTRPTTGKHWWTELEPLTEIEPISFSTLDSYSGGGLNLRGTTHPLSRSTVQAIRNGVAGPGSLSVIDLPIYDPVVSWPVDTLADVRSVSASAVLTETAVDDAIARPLLRLICGEEYEICPQLKLDCGRVDYGIRFDGSVVSIAEVKLRLQVPRSGTNEHTRQLLKYMSETKMEILTIDVNHIRVFDRGANIIASFDRTELTMEDVREIRAVLLLDCTPTQAECALPRSVVCA